VWEIEKRKRERNRKKKGQKEEREIDCEEGESGVLTLFKHLSGAPL
jgi:hypothetical protein